MRRIALLLFALTAVLPLKAQAQFAGDQPKSLRGIRIVVFSMNAPGPKLDAATSADIYNAATLELRKAGLRVKAESPGDAAVSFGLFLRTGLEDFLQVKMDVEQKVTVLRTGEPLQLVTWYYEDAASVSNWRTAIKPMAMKAVDKFISDWLEANGR